MPAFKTSTPATAHFTYVPPTYLKPVHCTKRSTAIIIDGSALNVWKKQAGIHHLDHKAFVDKICPADCRVDLAEVHFGVQSPSDAGYNKDFDIKTRKFFSALERVDPRCKVVLGRIQIHDDGRFGQKEVDVAIGLSLQRKVLKKQFDTVILVAGDGDFTVAVREAKAEANGTRVVVAVPDFGIQKHSVSRWLMREAGDDAIWISEHAFHACATRYFPNRAAA